MLLSSRRFCSIRFIRRHELFSICLLAGLALDKCYSLVIIKTTMPNKSKFARVLFVLYGAGYLSDTECRGPVRDFIRKSTEPSSNWHATAHFRSRAASIMLNGKKFNSKSDYQNFCSKNLSHEHVVPNSALHEILLREPILNEKTIFRHLQSYGIRATITQEENKLLCQAGLQSKMPVGFWTDGDPLYKDAFARYKTIFIDGDISLFNTLQPLVLESWLNES